MKNGAKPHNYRPANRCIYCDAVVDIQHLRREHIIPEGIGGKLILPKSSCSVCADVTSTFEGKVQHDLMGIFREKFNLRKRSHKKRERVPQFVELSAVNNPNMVIKRIPAVDVPGILLMPIFRMPCVLENRVPTGELSIQTIVRPTYHGALLDFADTITGWIASIGKYDPLPFARMLAKIGHSFAVAEIGHEKFSRLFLEKVICGIDPFYPDNCVGSLPDSVGGNLHTIAIEPDLRHEISLSRHRQRDDCEAVIVKIRLFANYGGPEYLVVVGEIPQRISWGRGVS